MSTFVHQADRFNNFSTRLSGLYEGKFDHIKSNIIFDSVQLEELTPANIEDLNAFHMEKIELIEKNDDYFCGIRADHFAVEIGMSEHHSGVVYLISANHKGIRVMTMIEMVV
ncbi:hypothetical protein IW492_03445 [Enterococcus sp. BWB1-3]|uniref:hypothetical protein n=1 Tax=Enterococcus sp. BWB1-3 TaxID=2787713 RepID=UPI001924D1E6|nr:hypothetical protein [Enterococcus sp. BWB1-3]MBL1228287.1 hypothetical protein [Enterococcus sp. BWB1-3]